MWFLHAYDKQNGKSTDAIKLGGRIPIPEDSTINNIVTLCVSINFIDTWLNILAETILWRCCEYQDKIKELFKQNPTEKKLLIL